MTGTVGSVTNPVPLDVNNDSVLADEVPSVKALVAAKEIVVSPPNTNDPARAVRRLRRRPVVRIGFPSSQVPATCSRGVYLTFGSSVNLRCAYRVN